MTGGNMREKTLAQTGQRRALVREAAEKLSRAGIEEAHLDARLLLEYAAGITVQDYMMDPFQVLPEEKVRAYHEAVEKRAARIPLQHITGQQEFMGYPFRVNEHVLIPRQDTETLVECALEKLEPEMEVLDLCTGSGCIAASLYLIGKKQGKVFPDRCFDAADISAEALDTARENCRALGAQVRLIHSDLFERIEGSYDMIVSNPPYIRRGVIEGLQEEVRLHDPYIALDGHEDGLYFYRRIADEAGRHLKRGGWVLLEVGHDQSKDVSRLLAEAGFTCIQGKKDLAGLDRVVMGMYNK